MKNKKFLKALASFMLSGAAAVGCFAMFGCGHSHTYSDEWVKTDPDKHWHEATCGHDDERGDEDDHDFDSNGKCVVCDYQKPKPAKHSHTLSSDWKDDANEHWKECTDPNCDDKGVKLEKSQHTLNADGTECIVCHKTFEVGGGDDDDPAVALATAKTNAKAQLAAYKNASDYTTNAEALAAAITAGNTAIDAATTTEGVATALANAKAAIDEIKSDATLAEEAAAAALATAKTNAKASLANYVDADDYTQNADLLEKAISDGNTAIDAATTTEGVATALANAKAAIDEIKSDAELGGEEDPAAVLAKAKTDAKAELAAYKKAEDYTTNAAALEKAISDGNTAIDAETTTAGVASALASAKAEIDKIKPDASMTQYDKLVAQNKTLVMIDNTLTSGTHLTVKENNDVPGIYMLADKDSNYTAEYVEVIDETDNGVTVKALKQVGTGETDQPNIITDIVLGQTSGKLEGYFEFKLDVLISATSNSSQQPIRFLDASGAVKLQIGEKKNGKLYYKVGSGSEVDITATSLKENEYATVYFVYEDGKITVVINDNEVVKDAEIGNSLSVVRLISSNKGGRRVTARKIIVTGSPMSVAEKAQIKLNALTNAYNVYDVENTTTYDNEGKDAITAAYNTGKTLLEGYIANAEATEEQVNQAYNDAIAGMKEVLTIADKEAAAAQEALDNAKQTAIDVINAKEPAEELTGTEEEIAIKQQNIAKQKQEWIGKINAVKVTDENAVATVEQLQADALADLDDYFSTINQSIEQSIADAKADIDSYADGVIDEMTDYIEDEKTTLKRIINTAIATTVSAQKDTLDAATLETLDGLIADAESEIDKAIAAEFDKDVTVTLAATGVNATMTVKFGTKLQADDLHVTAYELSNPQYNGDDLPEGGLLITEATSITVTLTELDSFEASLNWVPSTADTDAADILDNSLITVHSDKPGGYLAPTKAVDLTINGKAPTYGWQSDNITANRTGVSGKEDTVEDNGTILEVTVKENLSSLTLYIGLADSKWNSNRTGTIHVKINNVESGTPAEQSGLVTKKVDLSNLSVNDKVTINFSGLSDGSRLWLFGIEAEADISNVPIASKVTWKNSGENGSVVQAATEFHYYDAVCPELTPTKGANDKGVFLGWKDEEGNVYNTGDKLPKGEYTLTAYYAYNVEVIVVVDTEDNEGTPVDVEWDNGRLYLYGDEEVLITGLPNLSAGTKKHIGWTIDGSTFDPATAVNVGTVDAPATYTLKAVYEEVEAVDTVAISLKDDKTAEVEVNKTLDLNDTLAVTVTGTEGNTLEDRDITWSIVVDANDEEITGAATIENGVLTGTTAGVVKVKATVDGKSSNAVKVTVKEAEKETGTLALPTTLSGAGFTIKDKAENSVITVSSTDAWTSKADVPVEGDSTEAAIHTTGNNKKVIITSTKAAKVVLIVGATNSGISQTEAGTFTCTSNVSSHKIDNVSVSKPSTNNYVVKATIELELAADETITFSCDKRCVLFEISYEYSK